MTSLIVPQTFHFSRSLPFPSNPPYNIYPRFEGRKEEVMLKCTCNPRVPDLHLPHRSFVQFALSCFASGDFGILICYAVKWGSSVNIRVSCTVPTHVRAPARAQKKGRSARERARGWGERRRDALSRAHASARLQQLLGRLSEDNSFAQPPFRRLCTDQLARGETGI